MAIRIVVVDGSRVIHSKVASVCLADPDIQLVGDAVDGQDALEVVRAARPDVVLIDIGTPNMDGVETARCLIEQQPVKVIALTGLCEHPYVHDMLSLGAVGYLDKDAPVEDLVSAIRAAHRGSTVLSPLAAALLIDPGIKRPQLDFGLTEREIEVLILMGQGLTDSRIAIALAVSTSTIRFHQNNILQKMNVTTRSQALVSAVRSGLI